MNAPSDDSKNTLANEALFSIMFVSVGFSCFIWQSFTTGWMAYKSRKPIVILVFFQAILGVFATFITLLIAFVNLDCTFRLYFSVICVNVADISLQFILLWKAYLGSLPILAIAVFILINLTVGKSNTKYRLGVCLTEYPTYIVIVKAAIDFTSNIFLSSCFVLVIYRHYRLLGGNTPIIYTVDWYLASYLIIRQLRHNKRERNLDERKVTEEEEEEDEEEIISTPECTKSTDQEGNHCYHVLWQ
ncbi:hypothetical protein RO3G_07832 [Rhizopus delemar RA 99-880]|uniref:Uncharacterized protein n=1 Tax=Rhizopus delemar (strain RA 99-880 / ATCC MYA-4621 / FGSC 9543 / NRRL 43880) TaxID=246409 RepID=I1C3U7_RHIO9|nr:hypothetical protein RO3G_07832 [Rhizopus delemar RA 99-880]|eukprot:EIE83127.1 hypothetical protein RO3G_07832 [Rhizopus delemar RA 99-880]